VQHKRGPFQFPKRDQVLPAPAPAQRHTRLLCPLASERQTKGFLLHDNDDKHFKSPAFSPSRADGMVEATWGNFLTRFTRHVMSGLSMGRCVRVYNHVIISIQHWLLGR